MTLSGPALDAAFQHRLERLVGGVVAVERQVVAEHDEAVRSRRAAASIRPAGSRYPRDGSRSASAGRRLAALALIAACAALTSDDLPMPRAPHSSALLAGRPSAKRSVFSIRMSRIAVDALEQARSTRLTRGTGASASIRMPDKGVGGAEESAAARAGEPDRWAAMASSASRDPLGGAVVWTPVAGRFVAAWRPCDCRLVALGGAVLGGFFDMVEFLTAHPIGPCRPPQAAQMRGLAALQLGRWPL